MGQDIRIGTAASTFVEKYSTNQHWLDFSINFVVSLYRLQSLNIFLSTPLSRYTDYRVWTFFYQLRCLAIQIAVFGHFYELHGLETFYRNSNDPHVTLTLKTFKQLTSFLL